MLTRTYFPSVYRSGRRTWDPFRDLAHIHDEFSRLLDRSGQGGMSSTEYPPVNVWTSEDDVIVEAEMPGFSPDGIDISVVQNTLTLRGERRPEERKDGESWHRRERWTGRFVRTLEMPFEVDNEKVEAEYKNGMLRIRLPRAEENKPRKIAVKGS
jgi:HSP20 family protein